MQNPNNIRHEVKKRDKKGKNPSWLHAFLVWLKNQTDLSSVVIIIGIDSPIKSLQAGCR
jgi:hypothetical protein